MAMAARSIEQSHITTKSLPPGFGVEILGMDVANASPSDLEIFDAICRNNPVVVVRDQKLDAAQVVKLAGRLGRLSSQHRTGPHPEFPEISILSNKKVDGKYIGAHEVGRSWHTDGTTYTKLGLVTMLYGVECPAEGSDTLIADTAAAWEALPPERRAELEKVQVVHSRLKLFQKYKAQLSEDDMRNMHDVVHPIVVTSPVDGRKALFLTKGSTKGMVGMSDEDAHKLMDELVQFATQERFVYRHRWRPHDILIWNDLATVHSATSYDETKYDRLVYRAWMRPFTTEFEEIGPAH